MLIKITCFDRTWYSYRRCSKNMLYVKKHILTSRLTYSKQVTICNMRVISNNHMKTVWFVKTCSKLEIEQVEVYLKATRHKTPVNESKNVRDESNYPSSHNYAIIWVNNRLSNVWSASITLNRYVTIRSRPVCISITHGTVMTGGVALSDVYSRIQIFAIYLNH